MPVIRPEAAAALMRWREVGAGAALAALGLWWGLAAHGLLAWLGWGLVALGAALALSGWRRARFDQGRAGPGVVTVDEGAIAYFGPHDGGVIALSELTRIELHPPAGTPDHPEHPGRPLRPGRPLGPGHWRLIAPGQGAGRLDIPVNAAGAAALFDVFSALPGLDTPAMLAALGKPGGAVILIWQGERLRLH